MMLRSDALWQRAQRVLAGGPATLSKHPGRFPIGLAPMFLARGEGAYVWDVDGNRYIDTIAALGPILLGHNHPHVTHAVWGQSERLTSASLSTALEVEVAEQLVELIPGAEQVRFASNGKDVTEAAVKLARYTTGKWHAVYIGYHGGFSDYLSTTDKDGGLLPHLATHNHQLRWRDMAQLDALLVHIGNDLACLMLEVPPEPWGTPVEETAAVLRQYQERALTHRALFVLDEVVTGFRYGLGGAQAMYGVTADLACFSKGMANGYKLAALTGPRALMQVFDGGRVFLSTTFGGEATALAACQATFDVLTKTAALQQMADAGIQVGNALYAYIRDYGVPLSLRGNQARLVIDFGEAPGRATAAELRTLWLQELVKYGVLASVPVFPMCCYTAEIVEQLQYAFCVACHVLAQVVHDQRPLRDVLECEPITDVFSQRYRAQGPVG